MARRHTFFEGVICVAIVTGNLVVRLSVSFESIKESQREERPCLFGGERVGEKTAVEPSVFTYVLGRLFASVVFLRAFSFDATAFYARLPFKSSNRGAGK